MSGVWVTPREAAALDRLLDAYLATEDPASPGVADLVTLHAKTTRLPQDHRAWQPHFTCPVCGATSHHPHDIHHGYCARCHDFTGNAPGPVS